MFQSTYLYKVRLFLQLHIWRYYLFQSTYLYKVRLICLAVTLPIPGFNPRTYIRYDFLFIPLNGWANSFNPRTYIRYDSLWYAHRLLFRLFQSTYLYKVRPTDLAKAFLLAGFNPRTYIRYDSPGFSFWANAICFNPRTYIRYDAAVLSFFLQKFLFQSTYLYKVRHPACHRLQHPFQFQSTYLYKVRHADGKGRFLSFKFQSTYLYKVRPTQDIYIMPTHSFNPRTYIRYDKSPRYIRQKLKVSIHVPI